jgi:tellurite resistance protein TerC
MLDVTVAGWAATLAVIAGLFVIDLFVSRPGHAHAVGFREAALASAFYVGVAIAFGLAFGVIAGWDSGAEYPRRARHARRLHRARRRADLGVLVHVPDLRPAADRHRRPALPASRRRPGGRCERPRAPDPPGHPGHLRLPRRRMLTRLDGRRVATPLFIALVAIGSSDLLFALDSIPAVFGVTREPFIVFAANAFALLGLRALYFLVTGLLDRLVYLSLASLLKARRDPRARAHAGSLRESRRARERDA